MHVMYQMRDLSIHPVGRKSIYRKSSIKHPPGAYLFQAYLMGSWGGLNKKRGAYLI